MAQTPVIQRLVPAEAKMRETVSWYCVLVDLSSVLNKFEVSCEILLCFVVIMMMMMMAHHSVPRRKISAYP